MIHIRPHKVLDLVEEEQRLAKIILPVRTSLTSMLERGIMISLLKIIKPENVFEFGTFLGEMTLAFAENSDATIYTLDLGNEFVSEKIDVHEVKNLVQHRSQKKMFENSLHISRIHELFGDSTEFDFSPYYKKIDFILIDGGHHIDVIKSDTQNSFKMLSKQRPACIVWHDYTNPNYEIGLFLDDLSLNKKLFHIEETGYVFYLSGIELSEGLSNKFSEIMEGVDGKA